MFNALCKKLAKKNRGFTLIELIVVIAILGVLIAILVPSMLGFMDNARKTSVKAEAKTILTAAQSYMTSEVLINNVPAATAQGTCDMTNLAAKNLVDANIGSHGQLSITAWGADNVTITGMEWKNTDSNITATYANGVWTVA